VVDQDHRCPGPRCRFSVSRASAVDRGFVSKPAGALRRAEVAIDSAKTVASVTFPSAADRVSSSASMHVSAVATDNRSVRPQGHENVATSAVDAAIMRDFELGLMANDVRGVAGAQGARPSRMRRGSRSRSALADRPDPRSLIDWSRDRWAVAADWTLVWITFGELAGWSRADPVAVTRRAVGRAGRVREPHAVHPQPRRCAPAQRSV
jgi:hypothetical protein